MPRRYTRTDYHSWETSTYAHALQCSRGGAGQRTRCPRSATSAGSDATAAGHQASGTPKRFAPSRPCRRPPQHVLQTPGTTGVSARHQRPQPQVWQSQSQSAWNSISYCEVSGANNGASGSTRCGPIGLQRSGGWGGHMETGSAPDAHWQHTAGGGKAYCAAEPCQKAWRPTHLTPEHLQAASVGRQPSHTKKPELQTSRNQPASPNPAPAKPPSR